jgi:hypothetical protein
MVKFCASCGTANTPDAHFCSNCGNAIPSVMSAPDNSASTTPSSAEAAGAALPEPVPMSGEGAVYVEPALATEAVRPTRNWVVIICAAAVLLLVAALYFWLFVADDMASSGSTAPTTTAESSEAPALEQMFTMTEVNIRDKSTTVASNILGKLPRGSAVTGVLKIGEDGTSEWFELAEGKGFVAAVNLSGTEPPVLVKTLGDKIWTADGAFEIWSQPDSSSTLIDRVSEGTKLTLAGLTGNDYIEVKLKKGGVGYIADGAAIIARANGKPITISFNPQTCNFGGELETEFAKIGARLRAQWTALEDKEFVDEAAREKAYGAAEGKSTFVRMQRSYAGLSLTAIAQHYESQSLYFADPPARVIEAFRAKGFRIGRDGTFPSTELYAGISGTRSEGASYGKSELGCGV